MVPCESVVYKLLELNDGTSAVWAKIKFKVATLTGKHYILSKTLGDNANPII